jgi:hypothetical protein
MGWIKPATTDDHYFCGFATSEAGNVKGLDSYASGADCVLYARFNGLTPLTITSDQTFPTGSWTFFAVVVDITNSLLKVWINGTKKEVAITAGNPVSAGTNFALGRLGEYANYYNGAVDDFAIFNRALTDAEITDHYNGDDGAGSASASPSISPSVSVSLSPSPSPSVSVSLSPSISESASPSVSASASISLSPSLSASLSPSLSPSEGYQVYTKGDYAGLPADDTDLENAYTEQQETDVATSNDVRVGQTGTLQYMIHQYKDFVGDESYCTIEWEGQTSLAPSSSTVYLQIYNRNTSEWVTVDSDDFSSVDTDFVLTANIPDLTDYKDGAGIISCRVYQLAV